MKREFLINISFLILINVLIKPIYVFFIEAKVQDTLGPNEYGLYFGIFNLAFILQILADMGIQNYNSRTIASTPSLLKEHLPGTIGIKLVLSGVYLVVGILVAAIFGYLADSASIFILVSINLLLLSFILYLRTNIAATGHYRLDSMMSVLDKLILLCILSVLLFWPGLKEKFTIYSFILAQTFAFVIVFLTVLVINFKLTGFIKVKFDLVFSKKILKQSIPFSLVIVLMSLYMRMDGFMLDRMLDDDSFQAGVYAAAFRFYEAFNMIGYLFAVLLLPMFASLLKKKQALLELIKSSHNLILTIATLLLAGVILFREEIMLAMYPNHADAYYGQLLVLLMFSFFAISLSYIYGTYLTAKKELKKLNSLLFIGMLINLLFNLMAIPRYGAAGAAVVTILTQYFILGGQYFLTISDLEVRVDWKYFSRRILFLILVLVLTYSFSLINLSLHWFFALLILEFILLIPAILLGFIQGKDFLFKNPA